MSGPLDVIGGSSSGGGVVSGGTAPSSPSSGTLWYNTTAGALQLWDGTTWVAIGGGAGGATVSNTAPAAPTNGMLWFDPSTGKMQVWYNGVWIGASGSGGGGATPGANPPGAPANGQIWYDTVAGVLKVWDGSQWVITSSAVSPRGVASGPDRGSVQATFNADAITVGRNDVLIYTYGGSSYLYTGPIGAPVTAATAAQFTKLSSAVVIDSQFVALTGGADIGAAWTALTPKPTVGGATMTIATYNNSTYILTNEAAPGTAASWTIVGPADIWTAIGVDTYRNSKVRIGSTAAPLAVLDIAGGTQTTDTPGIHLAQTWNAAAAVFNAIKLNIVNTASAITSKLMDLQIGGVSVFNVSVNKRVGVNVANAAGTLEIASGTITALEPVLKMSQTWNAPGVAEKAIQLDITNTASGISSELANFTYDGRSVLGVFAADAGTLLEVVDKTSRVQFEVTDQGISTALPPGTTVTSVWKLGDVKTTTGATLSATQYVSVEIGGKIVKLAVVA